MRTFSWPFRKPKTDGKHPKGASVVRFSSHSPKLDREVTIDIFLPPHYFDDRAGSFPLLLLNDGQDGPALGLKETLESLFRSRKLRPIIVVAIHAGDRMQEYGTASQLDYLKRGNKAEAYTAFVTEELLPYLRNTYRIVGDPRQTAFAGFSMGGLSALDIVWHQPEHFGAVGVFSGSLWWRQRAVDEGYLDTRDRIMHQLIRKGAGKPPLRFWLQTGTNDEQGDRNQNGIIDAIDDTLDLITELEHKGYHLKTDIRYVEVEGGYHNQDTWGAVMPDFLQWVFGKAG